MHSDLKKKKNKKKTPACTVKSPGMLLHLILAERLRSDPGALFKYWYIYYIYTS